jgi:hypothetical protein
MKSPFTWLAIAASCFVISCASEADRGVQGTLRSTITDRDVDISVDHGVVTLEGKVNTEADRQRIEDLARQSAGVVAVKNNLEVKLPTPGNYGAVPGSTPVQAAPPQTVVTKPAEIVAGPPAVVAVPAPAGRAPAAVLVPNTPTIKIQPATTTDQVAADRIAQQLGRDGVPTDGLDHVTITVNSGTAAVAGVVDSESKRDALLTSVQRAGGISTIYDQLEVK